MGIFSTTRQVCDKCKKLTTFDGPYSDCGCYYPHNFKPVKIPELDNKTIKETMELVKKIEEEMYKLCSIED